MRLRVDTLDDLWYMAGIISPGDRVGSLTSRRDSQVTDKVREKAGERKTMFLVLSVLEVEFAEFSERLRVTGTILDGPQDLGAHHTINLERLSELTLRKEPWSRAALSRIDDAVRRSGIPPLTIVAIDDDEAMIGVVSDQGVREVATVYGRRRGKYDAGSGAREAKDPQVAFREEVLEALTPIGGEHILLAGPAFWKDEFAAFLRQHAPDLAKRVQLVPTPHGGRTGIQECLRSGEDKVLAETRAAVETKLVERVLAEIATEGKYAYGTGHVKEALEAGAVETLLVSERLLRSPELEQLGTVAQRTGADVRIIAKNHDSGRQLESLGGIAAILRYKRAHPR